MKNNHYTTNDLGLASALKAYNFEFTGITPGEGSRVFFVFKNDPRIIDAVDHYWRGNLSVDALAHFTAIKFLKSVIHSSRQ